MTCLFDQFNHADQNSITCRQNDVFNYYMLSLCMPGKKKDNNASYRHFYPLLMSEQQDKGIVPRQILELVSRYGQYEFLSRNCQTFASELMEMFNAHENSHRLEEIPRNTFIGRILKDTPDPSESEKARYFFVTLVYCKRLIPCNSQTSILVENHVIESYTHRKARYQYIEIQAAGIFLTGYVK